MPRKAAHILLSFLLTISTTGISLSMHYCGGEWVSTSINSEAEGCCEGEGGCCENKSFSIQLEEDFTAPVLQKISVIPVIDVLFPMAPVSFLEKSSIVEIKRVSPASSPPLLGTQAHLAWMQSFLC